MRTLLLSALAVSLMAAPGIAAAPPGPTPRDPAGYDPAIEKYVRFLEKPNPTPGEYILGLFERYDIVVLCERFHAETTQYALICELAKDPRFQEQVGHIFMEVGTTRLRAFVDSFLTQDQLSDEEVTDKLRHLARHMGWSPVWEKTNYYDFLRTLYALNGGLPKERRIHVYPSDLDFDWESASAESWSRFKRQELSRRDLLMAENIISKYAEIRRTSGRNKALVIMNYRHAFPHLGAEGGRRAENTTGFLMAAFPGRTANVMLSSVALLPGSTDQRTVFTAIQEGKWDAAFAVLGNPDCGFDFKGSPFGEDGFDYFPFIPTGLHYQEVFTGFVFFKPLEDHRMSTGLPGLFDQTFADDLRRRLAMTGQGMPEEDIAKLGTVRISGYEESNCAQKIQHWLNRKTR